MKTLAQASRRCSLYTVGAAITLLLRDRQNSSAAPIVLYRSIFVDMAKAPRPDQDYTMAGFADDLAWLCAELGLMKPIVVGHSMGGNVALELAARYPKIPASIVLIDSIVFPPPIIS